MLSLSIFIKRVEPFVRCTSHTMTAMISGETSSVAQNPDFGTAIKQMIEITGI